MKKRWRLCGIIALCLALIFSLFGCHRTNPDTPTDSSANGYKVTRLADLPESSNMYHQTVIGGQLYYQAPLIDEVTETDRGRGIRRWSPETGETVTLFPTEATTGRFVSFRFAVDASGGVWLWEWGDSGLTYITPDGTANAVALDTPFTHDGVLNGPSSGTAPGELCAVGERLVMIVRGADDGQQLVCIDREGHTVFSQDLETTNETELFALDETHCLLRNRTSGTITPVSMETGEKSADWSDNVKGEMLYSCAPQSGYAFLVQRDNTVYAYTANGRAEELFSFESLAFDFLNTNNRPYTYMDADGSVVVWEYGEPYCYRIAKGTVSPRPTLTVAGLGFPEKLKETALLNNRVSESYVMKLVDYSSGESSTVAQLEAGGTKLLTEMLGGTVPDVIVTSKYLSTAAMVKQGLLVDLYSLLDADETLSRADFTDSMLAAMEKDGGLYQLTGTVTLQTAVGNVELVGDSSLTWEKAESLMAANAGLTPVKSTVLQNRVLSALKYAVSAAAQSGSAAVNTAGNRRLLTTAAGLYTDDELLDLLLDDEFIAADSVNELTEKTALLVSTEVESLSTVAWLKKEYGSVMRYTGWPVENEGDSGHYLFAGKGYAITTACTDKAAAWALIRDMVQADSAASDTLSTLRADFEQSMAQSSLSEADIQPLLAAVASANNMLYADLSVSAMVDEEAAKVFQKQNSAEEALQSLQSRLTIYVNEQQ